MRIITYKTSYAGTYIYVPVPGTILSSHVCSGQSQFWGQCSPSCQICVVDFLIYFGIFSIVYLGLLHNQLVV